ncbi:MAG TPA: SPFH domain-containing protein [Kofleriaceae bacterium]|jgi:membrane protease subunit HflC|nr:SPFH domain-containing protein [Kofleriaceae bacterium]
MSKADKAGAQARAVLKKLTGGPGTIWIVAAMLALVLIAFRACVTLEPGHVAVRVNNVTGSIETITQPGLVMRLPFGVHTVHVVDASPQTFHMRGDKNVDQLNVRELTVRASDGSNFVFNDTTILFKVIPAAGAQVIADAGVAHRYRMWMGSYARSILRDEFGRESTISVSNPTTFNQATERARKRMNDLLTKHGIEVTSIVTPRPRFSDEYENLIEARNQAANELSVIDSNLERAATDRTRRLAEVDRDQNKIMQEKRAALETALATAVATQTQTRREVDTYKIEKIAGGQASLSAARQTAIELRGQLDAQYSTRKAEIDAFRAQPVERVMERLGKRLEGVTIDIQPWANDSVPSRLEIEKVGGAE